MWKLVLKYAASFNTNFGNYELLINFTNYLFLQLPPKIQNSERKSSLKIMDKTKLNFIGHFNDCQKAQISPEY